MKTRRALILAGGLGTRLGAMTKRTPKCLVSVGPHVLLDRWVRALLDVGVPEAVINTHHLRDRVVEKIDEVNRTTRLCLVESHEPALLGSAGTLAQNRELASGASSVVVIYADNLSTVSLAELLAFHDAHDLEGTMLLFRAAAPRACGIVSLDGSGTVTSFVEKPAEPSSDLANAGVYVFDAALYREIADMRAFDLGRDVLPHLVGRMKGFVHGGYHRDIGTPDSLRQALLDVGSGALEGQV